MKKKLIDVISIAFLAMFGIAAGLTIVFLLATPAKSQVVPEIWGGASDSVTVIPAVFVDATGAIVTPTSPNVTVTKIDKAGNQTTLVSAAAMTAVSGVSNGYFYRFVTSQTDSAGVLYLATIKGTISGIVTGKVVVFRRSGIFNRIQANLDAQVSTRSTLVVTDNIGVNWSDITNSTSAQNLSNTTISSAGSVSGAVGSVAGGVGGNVTGSVGSVAGNVTGSVGSVAGNVTGSVASVTGSVGSVAGNVTGSVASVTGAVGSVTGSVGSVVGAVASVTNPVTVGTNSDKTGYALSNAGVDAIWDEPISAHTINATFGDTIMSNLNAKISTRSALTEDSNVGIDWSDIDNKTAIVALTNTTIGGACASAVELDELKIFLQGEPAELVYHYPAGSDVTNRPDSVSCYLPRYTGGTKQMTLIPTYDSRGRTTFYRKVDR